MPLIAIDQRRYEDEILVRSSSAEPPRRKRNFGPVIIDDKQWRCSVCILLPARGRDDAAAAAKPSIIIYRVCILCVSCLPSPLSSITVSSNSFLYIELFDWSFIFVKDDKAGEFNCPSLEFRAADPQHHNVLLQHESDVWLYRVSFSSVFLSHSFLFLLLCIRFSGS